jgi:hypothetical protein
MKQEIHEEIGVSKEIILSHECIGCTESKDGNFGIIFHVTLENTKDEIEAIFQKYSDDEMQEILYIPASEVFSFMTQE